MSRLGRARPSNWLAGRLGQQRPAGFFPALADSGSGSDSVAVAVAVALSDSGTGADSVLSGEPVALADSGSGADSAAVAPAVPEADSGSGADSVSVAVSVAFSDSGSGAESVFSGEPVSLAEAGTGSDSVALVRALTFPANPLALLVEILINGTWENISSYVYQRADIVITRGLPDETQSATPASMTLVLNNRDGRFSTKNPAGAWYPYLTRNAQVRVSISQFSATGDSYSGYRFWGEASSLPVAWDPTGNDVYASITVSGPFRRYVQSAPMGSALEQYYASLVTSGSAWAPYACWPCEDLTYAAQFASLLPGGGAMTWTGTPSLSSSQAFGGADPLPAVDGSSWHGQTGAPADTIGSGSVVQQVPGTYVFKVPSGVTAVTSVECDGGGGAGGDTDGTTGGSGGGGGEQAKESSVGVSAGTEYSYTVGAGGVLVAGDAGTAGANSVFTGGTKTVTAHGGGAGGYAGQTGGAGGTGSSNTTHSDGGAGGQGQSSATSGGSSSLNGTAGGGGQTTTNWTCPAGFTLVTIAALAAGGGGGNGSVIGGGGGGGGGYSYGSLAVTPSHSYTMKAGNGGSAQQAGGGSGCTGDSATVSATGGGGASGGTPGSAGTGTTSYGGSGFLGDGSGDGGQGGTSGTGTAGPIGDAPGGNGFDAFAGAGGGGAGSGATTGGKGGLGSITWTWGVAGTPEGGGGGGSAYAGGANGSSSGDGGDSGSAGGGGIAGASLSTPSLPASGTTVTSTYEFGVAVTVAGGTGTQVTINGTNQGSFDGTYFLPALGTIKLTYTVAPTWTWANVSPDGIAPGGGGAGALPAVGSASAYAAGTGAPGRVAFSWSGGTATPIAADIVRFLLDVDAAGSTDGARLVSILTYGTVARMDVTYHTGGQLELTGYNGAGTQLFDSGPLAFSADGQPLYVDVELTQSGSSIDWSIGAVIPGQNRLIAPSGSSGTVSGTVMYVSDILADPDGTVTGSTVLGWFTCQTEADTITNLAAVAGGYDGELAATRISRLCAASGLNFTLVGTPSDTPQMGPQQDDTLLNVLQSCADMDRGQLYETRDQLGVGYRTRVSMQNQSAALSAYYADSVISVPPKPTGDDQYVRNYVTITRNNGGSATAALTSGPMSVQPPPDGAGNYTYTQTVQAYADSQLANLAQWITDVGTVDEYRFPQLTFSLARSEAASLFGVIPGLDVGDFIEIPDPPSFLQSAVVKQLALGYTETLNMRKWDIAFNCVPESPYEGGDLPTW